MALHQICEFGPVARALVIEVNLDDDQFRDYAELTARDALQQGLVVSLVMPGPDTPTPKVEFEILDRYREQVHFDRDPSRVQVHYRDWPRVAEWISQHVPGRGANPSLLISGDTPDEPEGALLLKRAFGDFDAVNLQQVRDGLSGAEVWRVYPQGDGGRRRCFVAKLQSLDDARQEESKVQMLRDALPSRSCAWPFADRCVYGHRKGLVVYDVVDRAHPFLPCVAARPAVTIASLFDEVLGDARSGAVLVARPLGSVLVDENPKVVRWTSALAEAGEKAVSAYASPFDSRELSVRLTALADTEYLQGIVHGDLHWGNLFVAGGGDVILIDFRRAEKTAPLVTDPACLEVSLTFPPAPSRDHAHVRWCPIEQRSHWLEHVYSDLTSNPIPNLDGESEWLSTAIRHIRERAAGIDPSRIAYAMAVAAHLLRFASYEGNGNLDERALAFAFAARMIRRIRLEKGRS